MSLSFRTNGNFIDFVNTDATSINVETIIMKLHNTSRCIDWSLPEDTTKISFTIDEVKYSNIPISSIDFDGTVMNSQDDFETGITGMFSGLAGGGSGGVESVTGDAVDNTDPANPVINSVGGSVSYKMVEVELDNDEIKGLPNDYVVLLQGEAGKAKLVTHIAFWKNTAAGAYVTTNNNIVFVYQNFAETSIINTSISFDNTTNEVAIRLITGDVLLDEFENIDVAVIGTGDPYTGGNAANTLKLQIFYAEISLT